MWCSFCTHRQNLFNTTSSRGTSKRTLNAKCIRSSHLQWSLMLISREEWQWERTTSSQCMKTTSTISGSRSLLTSLMGTMPAEVLLKCHSNKRCTRETLNLMWPSSMMNYLITEMNSSLQPTMKPCLVSVNHVWQHSSIHTVTLLSSMLSTSLTSWRKWRQSKMRKRSSSPSSSTSGSLFRTKTTSFTCSLWTRTSSKL